ncbi:NACHT and WD repeat domain-containing protein [Herbidospora mongoliensis]|uniref:NACHT and WD repeat domain-containing protein n=1 Tax=Herbidospora mongoliensis TaxID=688067 RepID=UPI000A5FA4BF|nr:hypothetical protein [Herbidospora mongoliensis]
MSSRPPYPGLAAFGALDAAVFFGRDDLLSDLRRRTGSEKLVVVTGASGAGKTSLVDVGLAGGLRLRPGDDPVGALLAAFGATMDHDRLAAAPHHLDELGDPGLIVVDRFEEVFAACRDLTARQTFIGALAATRAHVVLVLRADFTGDAAAFPELVAALSRPLIVSPLSLDDLRTAIEQPALALGVTFEDGLVEEILADQNGDLPLLAHTLRVMWDRGAGDVLTFEAYRATGRVTGAIPRSAERALVRNDARAALSALTGPLGTLRTGPMSPELAPFVAAGLVRSDGETAELAHEAVVRAWPRFTAWTEADRAAGQVRREFAVDANRWVLSGFDAAHLYQDARLAAARAAVKRARHDLSPAEVAFLDASAAQAMAGRRAAEKRTFLRGLLSIAVVALLVVSFGTTGALALLFDGATRDRDAAVDRSTTAVARHLLAQGDALAADQPVLARLLRLAGAVIAPALPEAAAGLRASAVHPALDVLHPPGVETMVVSAAGLLATVSGGEVTLWLEDKKTAVVPAHDAPISALAFTRDGRRFATAASDGSVRIWNTATRERLAVIADGGLGRKGLAFSADARTIAVAAAGRPVTIWNTTTAQQVLEVPATAGNRPLVLYGNDAATFYTLTADGLEVFDLPSEKRLRVLPSEEVTTAALNPNTRTLAVGRADGGVEIWGVGEREFVKRADFAAHDRAVEAIAFSPDGTTFTTGGGDEAVRIWETIGQRRIGATITGHTGTVVDVAYTPGGHTLLTAATDRTVRIWNLDAYDSVLDLTTRVADPGSGRFATVNAITFNQDGTIFATGDADGSVRLWRTASRSPLGVPIETRDSGVHSMVFDPQTGGLVVLSSDNVISLLDVDSRTSQTLWANPPQEATGHGVLGPDGRTLALAYGSVVELWDNQTRRRTGRLGGHDGDVRAVAFSPDGRLLATGGADRVIRLWDPSRAVPAGPALLGHTGDVLSVAFSPDGSVLASGDASGVIRFWDTATGRHLGTYHGRAPAGGAPAFAASALAFSPDGGTLVGGGRFTAPGQPALEIWDSTLYGADAHDLVCDQAGRALTPEEWRTHVPGQPYRRVC